MQYDTVIIGGGPGGYVAAIRAAQNGRRTALIEADQLGGTCLNRGCIPSKTLLKHAETIDEIKKAKKFGIHTGDVSISLKDMLGHKDEVIETLRSGIRYLMSKGKIDVYEGRGTLHAGKKVTVQLADETKQLTAEKIIIATGSRPSVPPIEGVETISYHTTDTIFSIEEIPATLLIVGGGVIGVEIASIFSSLGTAVTIVELGGRIIPTEDEEASKAVLKALKAKGIKVQVNSQVAAFAEDGHSIEVVIAAADGKTETITVDEVLLAAGRTPNTEALSEADIAMNGKFIAVNDYLETSEEGCFAIGDVIGGLQLAHVASAEGVTAAENLEGLKEKMDYRVIPRCVYTSPQVASVGMSEVQLKENNIQYKTAVYPLAGNGKALAMGAPEGFCKVMIDERYGEILGVVMVGAYVTEMISQSSAYMYLEGTADEWAKMVQPHPSISEVLMEAASALIGKGIHS